MSFIISLVLSDTISVVESKRIGLSFTKTKTKLTKIDSILVRN